MAERIRVFIYEPYPFGRIAGNLRTLIYILRFTEAGIARRKPLNISTPKIARAF